MLLILSGCATSHGIGGSGSPPLGVPTTATKKELPWIQVLGGQMKTTLFYGPWQCRQEFMRMCQRECAQQGHPLMGCMWLADLKLDWAGRLIVPPLPVKAGGRYGIFHCCCTYPTRTKAENLAARTDWRSGMKSFREEWSKKFGEWPVEDGKAWPGHHIHDLWHGGAALDGNNIIPAEPAVHDVFNREYPKCYAGQAPWNTVGPNMPYPDH